jgi:hypothetical protein
VAAAPDVVLNAEGIDGVGGSDVDWSKHSPRGRMLGL